jgi:puromycin-sensitive aminopeptidase
VEKPEDAAGMFDILTYEKGASVLRMLEQYLGAEAFRDGIRLYLRQHQYDTAETTDLWDALEESTRQPVRALMDSWIFQAGYPLITVERDGAAAVLSQRIFRYLQDGEAPERIYHVPVFLRAGGSKGVTSKTVLLTEPQSRVEIPQDCEWLVVNAGGHGFYRTRYSSDLSTALRKNFQRNLSSVERFGMLNDSWATTLAGLTSVTDYLDLLDLLKEETDLNVWTTAIISCHQLERILDSGQESTLSARVREIFQPAVNRLGWSARDAESELDRQLRGDLIGTLGTVGEDKDCQQRARALYEVYEKEPDSVERNMIPALISILAYTGGEAEYEKFHKKFKTAETPQEETRYLFALAGFRSDALMERTLGMTISGEVRTQNAPYLMRSLLLNKNAREKAWKFLKQHWDEMLRQYPDNSIPRMCEGIVGLVSAPLEADVRDFFKRHPVKQGAKQMEQHLERLRVAVACQERWKKLLRG